MTINEFIEKYSTHNFDSYIKENATIDYWNDLIKTYKLEKLKFIFPESMQLTLNPLLKEGNDMFWGKEFDGFCERQIEILKIKEQYKPQQVEAVKPEKTLLEFKEFLNRYEKEALQIDLRAEFPLVYDILERYKMKLNSATFDSDIDEVIVFCKKAVNETKENINTSIINEHCNQKYKSGKPSFLLQLKLYYEYLELYKLAVNKTNQPQQPEIPQKNKEIEQYLQSYKHSYFSSVIDKQNNNKQDNILFYGKVTADVLEQRNKDLLSNKILKERSKLLSNYNKRLYYLTGHTMQLFKAVNDYSNTTDSSYLTKIKINENEVFISLNELKKITKSIKHNLLNEEIKTASKIRDYCILMYDDCIDLLKDSFGIDIYKSPLNTHFGNAKQELKDSINFAELKIINEFSKNAPEAPKQLEANKLDEALLKNEYIKIFKNDLGFTLFTKMFELYKPDNKDLANFSFLFFAMEKDFLVCSQVDFVKFLEIEKYNVSIEKIDNRQFKWQINKKSKLYNSIKEPLQKKHEKSTI